MLFTIRETIAAENQALKSDTGAPHAFWRKASLLLRNASIPEPCFKADAKAYKNGSINVK